MLQVAISGDESVKSLCFCAIKKIAIREGRPVHLRCGHDLVFGQMPTQRNRGSLIEQNSQSGGFQGARRMLKHGSSLLK